MGHLIAAPLIPLKSHQAVADGRSSSYSGPRPSQTASKQPATLRNTPMSPNMSPTERPHRGKAAHGGGAPMPATHLSPRVPAGTVSRGWNSPPGPHTQQGPDQKVQMLLTVPPGQARLGTLLRRAHTLPHAFISPADPAPCPHGEGPDGSHL